ASMCETCSPLTLRPSLSRPRPPGSTLFPYTTLFRSLDHGGGDQQVDPACLELGHDGLLLRRLHSPVHQADPQFRELLRQALEGRSEEHTSELQSRENLVCRLLLEKNKEQPLTNIVLA